MRGTRAKVLYKMAVDLLSKGTGSGVKEVGLRKFWYWLRSPSGQFKLDSKGQRIRRDYTTGIIITTGRRRLYKMLKVLYKRGLLTRENIEGAVSTVLKDMPTTA